MGETDMGAISHLMPLNNFRWELGWTPSEEVYSLNFPLANRDYQLNPHKSTTLLGQLIESYKTAYTKWPWNESFTDKAVWGLLFRTLNPTQARDPFCYFVQNGTDITASVMAVDSSIINAGYWLIPEFIRWGLQEKVQFTHQLEKQRFAHGWHDPYVTVITEVFAKPDGEDKMTPSSPRLHTKPGEAIFSLFRHIANRQIIAHRPQYIGVTIRKKDGVPGKQTRMYQMVRALGGEVLVVLGDLPTNPTMEKVVLGGNLSDALDILEEHKDNMQAYMLHFLRRERREVNLYI